MSLLDKKYILTINLEDSSISSPFNMSFFNTDENIAILYVKVQYREDIIKYLSKEDAINYNIKLTIVKPKTNALREIEGVITDEIGEDCAIYKFKLPSEFTDQVGEVACEFVITNSEEKLTIDPFSYEIKASKVTGLNLEITTNADFPILKQLIEEVKKAQQWISNIDDINSSEVKTYSSKKIDEQYNTKASKDELEVERQRINTFTSLEEGSTTGDAELIDIRVGLDGLNYDSAGNSIRSQLSFFKNMVGYYSTNKAIDFTVGYYSSDLTFKSTDIGISTTSQIDVSNTKTIKIIFPIANGSNQYIYTYADSNKTVYKRDTFIPSEKEMIFNIESSCKYFTIACTTNNKSQMYVGLLEDGNLNKIINNIANTNANNYFINKKYNALGDSITVGFIGQTDKTFMDRPYPTCIKDILGFSIVRNYGDSGTCIAQGYGVKPTLGMCVRYVNMDNDADIITVLGGVNDRDSNVPMGEFGSTDTSTFYGALKTLAVGLIKKYPNKTIIFITPLQRGVNETTNTVGLTTLDYANAIKKVASYYAIPCLDLYSMSNFYPAINENKSANSVDGLHPNQSYVENILSRRIAGYIKTLC